jgi:hypothetical protein
MKMSCERRGAKSDVGGPLLIAVEQRITALDVRITHGRDAEVRYSLRWREDYT